MANPFEKDNYKFYSIAQKVLLAGIIFINLSYLVFLFRNSSISKIFNLPKLYASSGLKYHFVILQAALFFALIYCLRNLLNIFENKNEGKIENFKKLLGIDNDIFLNFMQNIKDFINNDQSPNLLRKKILWKNYRGVENTEETTNKEKQFMKNFGKLQAFKFFFFFFKIFIAFEALIFLNFVCKKFFESNIINNLHFAFSLILMSFVIAQILIDSIQLIIGIFYSDKTLVEFQKKYKDFEEASNNFIIKYINPIFKPINIIFEKCFDKIDKAYKMNLKSFYEISEAKIGLPQL